MYRIDFYGGGCTVIRVRGIQSFPFVYTARNVTKTRWTRVPPGTTGDRAVSVRCRCDCTRGVHNIIIMRRTLVEVSAARGWRRRRDQPRCKWRGEQWSCALNTGKSPGNAEVLIVLFPSQSSRLRFLFFMAGFYFTMFITWARARVRKTEIHTYTKQSPGAEIRRACVRACVRV